VNVALAFVFGFALVALATWAHLVFWTRRLTLELPYASVEELVTPDGATIVLRRVSAPRERNPLVGPPVLLVHGLGANHRNNDLHPDYSLARYLESKGRDVWLLTLRSGQPTSGAARRAVRFEAMVQHDLPVAIAAVRERAGSESIDYLGFSMGGMLMYAALGRSVPEAWLRRVVLCGSPGSIGVARPLRKLVRLLPRWLVPGAPLRLVSRLVAFASEWFRTPFHGFAANDANVPPGLTRLALVNLVEDIPASLQADFAGFSAVGEARVGGVATLAGLARVSVPALFVAGSADNLAPVRSVKRAFDAWSAEQASTPKRFLAFGRSYGHEADYGHGDLAFGAHVASEIFPTIEEFLAEERLAAGEAGATAA
jgi:polyhydroxyalkanoate synthase